MWRQLIESDGSVAGLSVEDGAEASIDLQGFTYSGIHFVVVFCHDVSRRRLVEVGEALPRSLEEANTRNQWEEV